MAGEIVSRIIRAGFHCAKVLERFCRLTLRQFGQVRQQARRLQASTITRTDAVSSRKFRVQPLGCRFGTKLKLDDEL
jgi:hypothetical protein